MVEKKKITEGKKEADVDGASENASVSTSTAADENSLTDIH